MANFAPTSEIQTPQDEDWRARPLAPNRAGAELFQGLGEEVKGVATVGTEMVKKDLYNQIFDTTSASNYARIENTLNAMNPTGVNPEIESAKATLGKMTTARQQGKMNDAQYWAGINVKAKELRSRFPDWNQEIDEMFNQVTGAHTIESKLNQAVENSYYAGQAGKADEDEKSLNEQYNKYFPELSIIAPTQLAQWPHLPIEQRRALVIQAAQVRGKREMLSADHADLVNQATIGKANKEQAVSVYSKTANQTVQEFMKGIANSTGQDSDSLTKEIDLFANGKQAPTPEQSENISRHIAQVKIALQQRLLELRQQPGFDSMDATEQEKIEQSAMAPLLKIEELVNGGHYDLANQAVHAETWAAGQDVIAVRKALPELARAAAVQKLGGQAAQSIVALPPKVTDKANAVIAHGFGLKVGAGNATIDEAYTTINADDDRTPAQKTAALTATVDKALEIQKASDISPKATRDFVTQNFSAKGAGMNQVWAAASDNGKHNLFISLTDPALGDNILKTNDPKIIGQYRDWMADKFTSLPAARAGVGRIAEAFASGGSNNITYRYNPSLYKFEVVPPKPVALTNTAGSPMVYNADTRTQAVVASQALEPFNDELQRLGVFLKHSGVDPNGPDGIAHILEEMGLHGTDASAAQRAIAESQLAKLMKGKTKPTGSEDKEPEIIRSGSVGDIKTPDGKSVPNDAQLAPDGKWYVPDPNRKGKYMRVDHVDVDHNPFEGSKD